MVTEQHYDAPLQQGCYVFIACVVVECNPKHLEESVMRYGVVDQAEPIMSELWLFQVVEGVGADDAGLMFTEG